VDSKEYPHEVSDESKDTIGNWTREPVDIFVHVLRLCGRLSLKVTD
jgi:hypothetical protein